MFTVTWFSMYPLHC